MVSGASSPVSTCPVAGRRDDLHAIPLGCDERADLQRGVRECRRWLGVRARARTAGGAYAGREPGARARDGPGRDRARTRRTPRPRRGRSRPRGGRSLSRSISPLREEARPRTAPVRSGLPARARGGAARAVGERGERGANDGAAASRDQTADSARDLPPVGHCAAERLVERVGGGSRLGRRLHPAQALLVTASG